MRADDGTNGAELWVSDGSSAGTQMLKDINVYGDSHPVRFTESGGNLFFGANDSLHGAELWVTDGTSAGTRIVKDISTGTVASYPKFLTDYNGKLFFNAHDGTQIELWSSDGTTVNTQMFMDIYPGTTSGFPEYFAVYNNKLYFGANTPNFGKEIMSCDGTVTGTYLLKDIYAGTGSGAPTQFFQYDGKLFFTSYSATGGKELYVTDGTTVGTTLVKDINSNGNGYPHEFVEYNGKMFFAGAQGAGGPYLNIHLFYSDGTTSGTAKVPGIYDKNQKNLIAYHGKLYFTAVDGNFDRTMWQHTSDGVSFNTQKIAPTSATTADPFLDNEDFVEYKGALYFHANFDHRGDELWKFETPAPTAITQVDETDFHIYPNPTTDVLHIDCNQKPEQITVYDMAGKLLIQETKSANKLDIGKLTAGIYFVQITIEQKTIIKKIQKL